MGLLLLAFHGQGQAPAQSEEALANEYFKSGEFEKAAERYKKLYKKSEKEQYYAILLQCYQQIPDFKAAEKLVEKRIKSAINPVLYQVDLGQLYRIQGKQKKAEELDKSVQKVLGPYVNQLLEVGKKYYQFKNYKAAINTYKKGRKLLDGDYPFCFELAEVYAATQQHDKMVSEILLVLNYGPSYLEGVKNAISTQLYGDTEGKKRKLFKQEIIKNIQRDSENDAYSELLIWMHLDDKNYDGAYTYSVSLDRRNEENGRRLMELADLARRSSAYDVAIKCYQYVIDNRQESYYYRRSRSNLLSVLKEKLDASPVKNPTDLAALETSYKRTLSEIGTNTFTVQLQLEYAEVLAFYLGKASEALSIVKTAIELPRIKANEQAKCKLLLGDIYVFQDEVWEASLLYGQVNQDFKNDPIGYEAKLKAAKAYYYTGNFEWAKTQLDVLKAGTTKLIANDALQLSVLISDNLGMDTTTFALQMYAKADLLNFQGNTDSALAQLNALLDSFPDHLSLLDDAHYLKAAIYKKQQQWDLAIESYKKVVKAGDLLVDEALLELAKIYQFIKKDKESAMKNYEAILIDYPGSVFVVEARYQFRKLRGF